MLAFGNRARTILVEATPPIAESASYAGKVVPTDTVEESIGWSRCREDRAHSPKLN
jgi:hypothetical protein